MRQDVPCIPQGNDFKIAIVLKEKIKTDGEVSERDINILNNQVSVAIIKPNGDAVDNTQNVYSVALNGSTVIISFDQQGKNDANGLPKGKYGIEVTGKRSEDSSDFCFSLPIGFAFEIVAYSTQGHFPSDSIITYTVNGVVGVAQNVGGSGADVTIGTLDTTATEAQTPSASESFGSAINLHKVSKTGSYNDLRDKPTIPAAQVQADWNATSGMGAILNKPDVSGYYQKPTTGIPLTDLAEGVRYSLLLADGALQRMVVYVSYANNAYSSTGSFEQIVSAYEDGLDVVAIYDEEDIYRLSSVDNNAVTFERAGGQNGTLSLITITSSDAVSKSDIAIPDISGKEDRLAIETTIGTTAEMGMYYRLTTDTALTINLPEVSPPVARLEGFIVCLTIATGGSVTFVPHNQETILQSGLDDIADGKTYEINAVWNGLVWAITATELSTYNAE